ncbi:hypothetical protein DEO72_LG10g1726 [Vigna unguiculata]|uniref:Uncharacterized protein n=1 Tax=Vigna unguiculata TaxID=3917 RepID=A0A4D6N9S9_VIGUN|nr:hypothetical protein DEO72_LG10g1726 [Vigna unguiculata]
MSQDYQTRQLITEEGNPSGPIRTGHNQHTHTDNTRQPKLNSRVPRVHLPSRAQLEGCHSKLNSRNVTCLNPISRSTQGIRSELNSRNLAILPLKHHQKSCRSHIHKSRTHGRNNQIVWKGTRTIRSCQPLDRLAVTRTTRRLVPQN